MFVKRGLPINGCKYTSAKQRMSSVLLFIFETLFDYTASTILKPMLFKSSQKAG